MLVFDGRLWVIGGLGSAKSVDRFDPITKTWDKLADLPFGVDHAMAAAIEETTAAGIVLAGGFQNGQPSARSWYLPRDTEDWRQLNPMPGIRLAGAAVTIGTKIYVVGGATTQRNANAQTVYVFDLLGTPWTEKAKMPTGRTNLAAAAVDGKVCAFGGRELVITRNLTAAECYDPATDKWEAVPPLPTARSGIAGAAVGDRVVIAGGEEPQGVIKRVDVYDAKAKTWSSGPDLPTARQDLGLAAFGKTVYAVAGGGPSTGQQLFKTMEAWTLP